MRRRAAAVSLAGALLCGGPAGAQSIIDLLAPDTPAPKPARNVPEKKRAEPKAKKREGQKPAAPGAAKPEPQSSEAPPPPYEGQLVRLSELLGALAFLRDLCGEKDGDDWRAQMTALIDAEAPSGPRRDKLVANFNRGFRGYELTYRACTPNAKAVTARYLDEAARISRDVTYRFGSP